MSPQWNHRTDEYGGSFENRMRFLTEVYQSVRENVGPDVPVLVRLAITHDYEGGRTIEDSIPIVQYLEKLGVDALDIDVGSYENNQWITPSIYSGDGCMAFAAGAVKKVVGIPVISTGTFTPETANAAVENGQADFVMVGRGLIADPEWANKLREGREEDICPCLLCNHYCIGKLFQNQSIRCSVNAQAARETLFAITKTDAPKKVVVVGGGPGGMEAARVAAEKGHDVTLYEKSGGLGGQLEVAGDPEFKGRIRQYTAWLKRQVEKSGAKVMLNKTITADSPELENADQIVVALGATPLLPPISGIDGPNVVEVTQAHQDHSRIKGDKIVVAGGGMSGCDCALELAMQGKDVTIVEMLDQIAGKELYINTVRMFQLMDQYGVKRMTGTRVLRFTDAGVEVEGPGGTQTLPADTVVAAFGMKPESSPANAICEKYPDARAVGDCTGIGQIGDAVRGGFFAGWSVQ